MLVNLAVILLPLGSIFFFRIYENQLIQETERELISQAAVIAAFYEAQVRAEPLGDPPVGTVRQSTGTPQPSPSNYGPRASKTFGTSIWTPIQPQLDLARVDTLPARPDGREPDQPSTQLAVSAGRALSPALERAQLTSLVGVRVLDELGTAVGGTAEIGLNFAHIEEVQAALQGSYKSALRFRELVNAPTEYSSLATISRGTKVRVFVAFPIQLNDRVVGVVYLSRTPKSVLRHMYDERDKAILALVTVLALAIGLAWLTSRTISRPMAQILARTGRVARGDSPNLPPLEHPGTREMAELSDGIGKMADALVERAAYIRTLASHVSHEFKTPLASIQGAAELLHDMDAEMTAEERRRFVQNIQAGGERLKLLLDRLLELARAENAVRTDARVAIRPIAEAAFRNLPRTINVELEITETLQAQISEEALQIILSNLVENATQHGASNITLSAKRQRDEVVLQVADDGAGISPANRQKVFEHFFTTRRETGGTGLGLGIVRALAGVHGGSVRLVDADEGACFEVVLQA
ncbi:MAG: ATP-binding protein [Pseudomonadota bacterium]